MSVLEMICSTPLVQAVGMALLHFIWQGLLIGSLLYMTLIAMRDSSPQSRYAVCLAAMLFMLAAPIVTTGVILFGVAHTLSGVTPTVLAIPEESLVTGWTATFLPWFMGFWALGTSFLQARLIIDWFRIQRMKRVGIRLLPRSWQLDIDELHQRLGIEKAVGVFESSLVNVPSVVGCLRPVVLLPIDTTTRLAPPQLRAVIAHELAHIRRHDCLVNFLQSVFESILFFHPVVWWVCSRLHTEREYCCDDMAVSISGSALDYAQALSSLEELRGNQSRATLASTGGSLMERIARISEKTASTAVPGRWLLLLFTLAGVVALTSVFTIGCDTHAGGPGSASQIVGQAEADERVPLDQDTRLAEITATLEDCRDRGFITDGQLQAGIAKLTDMAADGNLVNCDEDADGQCRIMVMPGENARSNCCPQGASAKRVRSTEDLRSCIRGMENVPATSEIKVEEVDLGQGAALALISIEKGDPVE